MQDPIVIVGAKRTPMAHFLGNLASISAPELGAYAIKGALEDSGFYGEDVNEVLMGCVLPAGLGQSPARQAALRAELPESVGCTTISKVCGSGMRAIMLAADSIQAGSTEVVIAGGMESMSNTPYLLEKARTGYRMGHSKLIDHMFFDGLEDAYRKGCTMGEFADEIAEEYGMSRKLQDDFAAESARRALKADVSGIFTTEIIPIDIKTREGFKTITHDELPSLEKIEKIPKLKGIYGKSSTITAANASSISDGAAALIVTKKSIAEKKGLEIKAIIKGYCTYSQDPSRFPTAPIGALNFLSEKTGWVLKNVDLFEINEAFAMVALATMQDLNLPHEKVNIYGGSCALGHPIGASGARIIVTLLNALKREKKSKGMATLCIGGGEATALAIERV